MIGVIIRAGSGGYIRRQRVVRDGRRFGNKGKCLTVGKMISAALATIGW